MVEVDEVSRELCGGTHVGRTGEIGLCLFTSEGSVGANLRRLEAVTGTAAYDRVREIAATLEDVAGLVKADIGQVPARLEKIAGAPAGAGEGSGEELGAGALRRAGGSPG